MNILRRTNVTCMDEAISFPESFDELIECLGSHTSCDFDEIVSPGLPDKPGFEVEEWYQDNLDDILDKYGDQIRKEYDELYYSYKLGLLR